MGDVKLRLSPGAAEVYSGACLTYSGVPFHRVEKLRTAPEDLHRLNEMFDRFVQAKGELQERASDGGEGAVATSRPPSVDVVLSDEEADLLIEVLEAVLQEHLDADYDLRLHVAPRSEVDSALRSLRGIRRRQQAEK